MNLNLTTVMKIWFGMCAALVVQSCAQVPSTPEPGAEISWSRVESPIFPDTWPPTNNTIWISYTFAYGTSPALMDGARVSPPIAKTEWKNGISTTVETGTEMQAAAIQGIVPLDEEALAFLEAEARVSTFCLSLNGQPDLNTAETQEMLAFYNAWFRYNSAFLDLIRDDHNAFIDWVETTSQP